MKPTPKSRPSAARSRKKPKPTSPLIQRLNEIVRAEGVTETAKTLGMNRVNLHKLLNGSKSPGPITYARLYREYPTRFPELKILLEGRDGR